MTEEPWNNHTPGDPMPCKCGDSAVEVIFCAGGIAAGIAKYRNWGKLKYGPGDEITAWRFVERKGEDVIAAEDGPTLGLPSSRDYERGQWRSLDRVLALLNTYDCKEVPKKRLYHDVMDLRPVSAADPYDALEWDEDDTATVVLKKPGRPEWVRDDDLVRFCKRQLFSRAADRSVQWNHELAFQIKRRPILTPAEPQVLALLSVATDDEADAIRSAARRANIEVPE